MARTFIDPQTQIFNTDTYNDAVAPTEAAFETNPTNLEEDLNNIRSMLHELRDVQSSNWWAALTAATGFENGASRGVQDVNQDLHELERKRILKRQFNVGVDVSGGTGVQHVVLGAGELPSNTTIAVGAVNTLGTVVAEAGTFDSAVLDEVAGATALQPKNLVRLTDGTTGDQILQADGREIFGLLQSESSTDGSTASDTTPNRLQITFVVRNATNDDLELATAGEMDGRNFDFAAVERFALDDLSEEAFLGDGFVDAGGANITRQNAYNEQGTAPVDLTTNAVLDLEGAGISWTIRDDAEANLFQVSDGSGGQGTVLVAAGADLDVNAGASDFLNGISVDTGAAGTTIDIGVTAANTVTSGGALSMVSTAADLNLASGLELNLTDSYRAGSTWSLADGIQLAASSAEWDAFETQFGEVSLLAAITDAANPQIVKASANVTSTTAADTDVSLSDGNLDAALGDLSGGDFVGDHDIYYNGVLLRSGANAAANNDVYPGTDLNNSGDAQLRFEFQVKANRGVITVISRA